MKRGAVACWKPHAPLAYVTSCYSAGRLRRDRRAVLLYKDDRCARGVKKCSESKTMCEALTDEGAAGAALCLRLSRDVSELAYLWQRVGVRGGVVPFWTVRNTTASVRLKWAMPPLIETASLMCSRVALQQVCFGKQVEEQLKAGFPWLMLKMLEMVIRHNICLFSLELSK